MKKFIAHIVLVFSLFSLGAEAQRVAAVTDRQKILLGEQLQLEIKLESLPTERSSVTQWFNLPDSFDHLEVVNRLKIDTIDANGNHTYIQKFIITGFDSGRWVIPALSIHINDNNKPRVLQTQPIAIDVLPVDVSAMEDYHPIKDILEVQRKYDWWLWIALAVGALILLALIIWLFKRKKKDKPAAIKYKLPALQEAIEALDALRNTNVSERDFYLELENIYRRYFTRTLNFDAMQTTPDELMLRLKVVLPATDVQTGFFQLIRMIAAVKYAKFIPVSSERTNAIAVTTAAIKYIDEHKGGAVK